MNMQIDKSTINITGRKKAAPNKFRAAFDLT